MSPKPIRVALVGPPNSGKTTEFNILTGARQKVANYAGVTVEKKTGNCRTSAGRSLQLLDLPGTYSLYRPISPDERITQRICMNTDPNEAPVDLIVCVIDATNLRLHLKFALEIKQLGVPMILAVSRMDLAKKRGIYLDLAALESKIGLPVTTTTAQKKKSTQSALLESVERIITSKKSGLTISKNPTRSKAQSNFSANSLFEQVKTLLTSDVYKISHTSHIGTTIDRWALHPLFGFFILTSIMFGMFQAVFSWAEPVKNGIEESIMGLGTLVTYFLPKGSLLYSFINDGVFAGIGTVLVFCPQILFLFLFLLILEESGYLPRAAFLLDRLLLKAGLNGRAFIPLLSSFACTIPSIMATRSIQNPRDRLITILISPLITCSARLSIYTLLIAAFIPHKLILGYFNLQGIVLFSLYFLGVSSALIVSYFMKHFRYDQSEQILIMELPTYRLPKLRNIALGLLERAQIFLWNVGGIILALTVLLWFLSSFPTPPLGNTEPAIYYSFAGSIGKKLAFLFEPIGFNWQICIALIPGLAAREVVISSLGTVYAMSISANGHFSTQLSHLISEQWSLATALSLLVWYAFAPQCFSTLAVIRRETNSWRYMAITATYLFGLAYVMSFLTYRIALFW